MQKDHHNLGPKPTYPSPSKLFPCALIHDDDDFVIRTQHKSTLKKMLSVQYNIATVSSCRPIPVPSPSTPSPCGCRNHLSGLSRQAPPYSCREDWLPVPMLQEAAFCHILHLPIL